MKKKVKKYAEGGLAGIVGSAQSLMGKVNDMTNQINYGSSFESTPSLGFNSLGGAMRGNVGNNYASVSDADKVMPFPIGGYGSAIKGAMNAKKDFKKGGKVKVAKASTPKTSSASKRADGIATKGKTKGRFV